MFGWLTMHPLETSLIAFLLVYMAILIQGIVDWALLIKLSQVPVSCDTRTLPAVDIVIPARNEGGKIERCLQSIQQQTHLPFQVWMVNDRSTDNTEAIMAQFAATDSRFHLIPGVDPPPGWVGKVNAIAQALPYLTAPWVLFLDADTWLHPENLERSLTVAEDHSIDLLTLIPHLECETFWERVILPSVVFLIGLKFPSYLVNHPNSPVAIANGQYLLFRKTAYDRLGTHATVKHSVVEDLDLARLAKQKGLTLKIVSGLSYFKVRMYTSFADLREGWTKNMYFGNPDKWVGLYLLRIGVTVALGVYPLLALCVAAWFSLSMDSVILPLLAWGWMTVVIGIHRYLYRVYPAYALLFPLAMGLIGWFMWESRQMALSKTGVTWKGRHYKASTHAP